MSLNKERSSSMTGEFSSAALVTGPTAKNDVVDGSCLMQVVSERYETATFASGGDEEKQKSFGRILDFLGNFIGEASSLPSPASSNSRNGGHPPLELKDMTKNSERGDNGLTASAIVGDFDVCHEYSYTADEDDTDDDAPSDFGLEDESARRIFLLGMSYHPVKDHNDRKRYERALFWFTYRCNFPEIQPYGIRSDAGWGCMLRSAQMMLAQALRMHFKSRDWKPPRTFASRREDPFVRSILTWFADFPSTNQCYYSLHNMVAAGIKYDKLPGEWYGPSGACYVLRDLVELHERQQLLDKNTHEQNRIFRVHVASQGTVYRDVIHDLMTKESQAKMALETEKKHKVNPQSHPLDLAWEEELIEAVGNVVWDTGLLLLIPLRLGLDSFHTDYVRAVAHTFSFPQSVGVLGGRVRGARWFYGAVSDGSKVFGLDPHTVQSAPCCRWAKINGKPTSTVDLTDGYLRSCHTTCPEVLSLAKMDPSIALGFYCRNQGDLEQLFYLAKTWIQANPDQPEVFAVADAAPNYSYVANATHGSSLLAADVEDDNDGGSTSNENDDYVML